MWQRLNMPIVGVVRGAGIKQTETYTPASSDVILDLKICQTQRQESRHGIAMNARIGLMNTSSMLQDWVSSGNAACSNVTQAGRSAGIKGESIGAQWNGINARRNSSGDFCCSILL